MRIEGLPDSYRTVAADVLRYCQPDDGLWLDIGSGSGGIGIELARASNATVVLVDPNADGLRRAASEAASGGLGGRVLVIAGRVEHLPLRDGVADLVASRGSIFFWDDPAKGLREVHRALRSGGRAMIGGGLGEGYPKWAREEFTRRRLSSLEKQGAEAMAQFERTHNPDTFRQWARRAGLRDFEIAGEGGPAPQPPPARLGIWLRFAK
jgi:ubiquinone/menaquinone biosynthesis C-methylase UbiE